MAEGKPKIQVEVLTERGAIYQGEADCVFIPGENGKSAILPYHVPMVQLMSKGEIVVVSGSVRKKIADVESGVARVDDNLIYIMITK
jgi:F0F1-type ATP synthase epsilon subunit